MNDSAENDFVPAGEMSTSWDYAEQMGLQDRRRKIPRHTYIAFPGVIKDACQCNYSILKHDDFYSCWFDRVKKFVDKQRMQDYVDGIAPVVGPQGQRALRIVCTKLAAEKLVKQGPNLKGGMYPNMGGFVCQNLSEN